MADGDMHRRILAFLDTRRDQWLRPAEIAKNLDLRVAKDVNTYLYDLLEAGKLEQRMNREGTKPTWCVPSTVALEPQSARVSAANGNFSTGLVVQTETVVEEAETTERGSEIGIAAASPASEGGSSASPQLRFNQQEAAVEVMQTSQEVVSVQEAQNDAARLSSSTTAGETSSSSQGGHEERPDLQNDAARSSSSSTTPGASSLLSQRQESRGGREELPDLDQALRLWLVCKQFVRHEDLQQKLENAGIPLNGNESQGLYACIETARRHGVITPEEERMLLEVNSKANCAKHHPERLQPVGGMGSRE